MSQQDILQGSLAPDLDMPENGSFDTNMDVLPGKRTKGPGKAEEEPEEKPMSKRKKRKLEQLQKKHANKETRSQVLSDLRSMQLTPEQAQLMRASQSTRDSRKDQVTMAKRRLANGVALTKEQRHLRRRAGTKVVEEEEEVDEGSDEVADAPSCAPVAPIDDSTSFGGPATPVPFPVPSFAKEETQEAPVQLKPLPTPPAEKPLASSMHLLKPVRVDRTEKIEEQRAKLPAVMCEQEVIEMVLQNDVTLVSGDTGCGKSTQIPQFLYEAGVCVGDKYLIGVTQPRRVAAISVSQRVAEEVNQPEKVGYQVRYDRSHCSKDTRIKFMTDGILLRELQADFLCSKYAAVVIDEAHERGVNCDILIGLLSRAVQRRRRNYEEAVAAGRYKTSSPVDGDKAPLPPPPLRLIIMSATLRVCDFTENTVLFPRPPPVVKIDARTFPVTVHFSRSTEEDYVKAAHHSVLKIHKKLPPGTILVFVTGKQEVHQLCRLLRRTQAAALRNASAGQASDDEQPEDNDEDYGLLQGSDDEDVEFDDDLGIQAAVGADSDAAAPATNKRRKLKKKRKLSDTGPEQPSDTATAAAPADSSSAVASSNKLSKKKNKMKGEARVVATTVPEGTTPHTESTAASGQGAELKAADADECEVSYRIDTEEDVVVLESETLATDDAKDMEAKRQKRQKMVKLDKSRTAGGVFHGTGFGEGPYRVLPLYAQLPARDQLAAFENPKAGERTIIVSTNVAETSVTLPNVRYVVDSGQEKRREYKASSGVSSFVVDRISKASANQRAGRSGRLGPGHAYRLFSAAAYENHMRQFAPIAVLHVPMDPVLLLIASLGVPYLDLFPWPTPPPPEAVTAAMTRLQALGALADSDASKNNTACGRTLRCTQLGFRLASLPVAPRYAKMLLSAVMSSTDPTSHAIGHACALVAAFSIGNLVSLDITGSVDPDIAEDGPPQGENELVRAQREAQKRMREAQGKQLPPWTKLRDDADGLLWLMGGYAWAASNGDAHAERFCRENKANSRQMAEAHSLMQQLASLIKNRLSLEKAGITLDLPLMPRPPTPAQTQQLRACIANGLVDHVAVLKPELGRNAYVCKDLGPDHPVFVHVSSNSYRHRPQPSVLVFNEIISSSKAYMRDCIGLDPQMLSQRAALGDCSLLRLGEFLAVPAPRYLKDKDSVLGFASPTYAPLAYVLPTLEVEVPTDSIFRYKVFAKALLEGEVLNLPSVGASLLARPALVLNSPNNPRVMGIVGPLWQQRIGSRASLLVHWEKDRNFLLDGYLKWVPSALHDDTRMSWPPLGSGKKRAKVF